MPREGSTDTFKTVGSAHTRQGPLGGIIALAPPT